MRVTLVIPDAGEGPWERIMASGSREMAAVFESFGAVVATLSPGEVRADPNGSLKRLRDFGPDLVTAPNYNYWLLAAVGNADLLDLPIPILARWDDPLGALVNYSSYPVGSDPWKAPGRATRWLERLLRRRSSRLTAPAVFERVTENPSVLHVAWDTGHMEAFHSLGLDRKQPVHWEPVVVRQHFIEHGQKAGRREQVYDVGFCGNIYNHSMVQHPLWRDDFTRRLALRTVARKERDLGRSCWELLLSELEALPREVSQEKGLTSDRQPFWELYLFVAWTVFNSEVRLRVLGKVRRDVDIFGLFADPGSIATLGGRLRYGGNVDHGSELPRTYASIKVNICLSNGLIYRGTPSKLLDCIASGGFALCDPKPDVLRLFGPTAEKIFFRDVVELNEKIEYYLARPAERMELVRYFQSIIGECCTLNGYFSRVLPLLRQLPQAA